MSSFKTILDLIKLGVTAILPNCLNKIWIIITVIISYIFFLFSCQFDIVLSESISNLALPALSIFTALIFSAIFTVPSQLSQKLKELNNETDESTINFLIRYRNFISLFSKRLISLAFISIIIIVLILLNIFLINPLFKHILCSILILLSLCFIRLIIAVIINLNQMIEENIRFSTDKIRQKKNELE